MTGKRPFIAEALTVVGLIAAPFVLPHLGFAPTTINRILIWGLFGLGFDLLFGYAGLLSFGQSAFFGTGGMFAAYLLTEVNFPYVLVSIVIGALVAGVVGFLVGLIALRRTGIYFAMITVAIAEVFFFIEFNPLSDFTGGENGLPGVPAPSVYLGFTTLHFNSDWSMYVFLAFWYFVGLAIALRIVRSPVGAILSALRDNPLRASALGHNIHGYKLTAFVVAAAYAGFAGGLLAIMQGFMPPDAFMFDTSGQLVMQTAIGGAGTLFGPLVGATVWLYLSDFFQNTLHLGATWRLVLGVVFVLLVCFLRRGIVGAIVDLYRLAAGSRKARTPGRATVEPTAYPSAIKVVAATPPRGRERRLEPILEAKGLSKRYGGLTANSDIDFVVNRGEIRGIIGPNGAGKSTFFKMLTCETAPTSGRIVLEGRDITGMSVMRRLPARTHQKLSAQSAFRPADGQAESEGRGASADPRQVQAGSVPQRRTCPGPRRAGRPDARAHQSDREARRSGVRACLWREATARDRPRARDPAEAASARRASRRHESARACRDGRLAQVDCARPYVDHHRS